MNRLPLWRRLFVHRADRCWSCKRLLDGDGFPTAEGLVLCQDCARGYPWVMGGPPYKTEEGQ